jgi:hypothetical protein
MLFTNGSPAAADIPSSACGTRTKLMRREAAAHQLLPVQVYTLH